jgi:hypothetical protein
MSILNRACLVLPLAFALGGCWANIHEDEGSISKYFQRKDGVTLSAGNAKEANAVTHIGDPWPRYVGNRKIPADGQRMAGAGERYRDVTKLPQAAKPLISPTAQEIGIFSAGTN